MKMTKIMLFYLPILLNWNLIIMFLLIKPSSSSGPLFNGMILLFSMIISVFSMIFYSGTSMIPLIIFLILVGGLMVIFMYFACFTEHSQPSKFNFLTKYIKTIIILLPINIIFFKNIETNLFNFIKNSETLTLIEMVENNSFENYIKLSQIYMMENSTMLFFLVLFMVLCFITMTNICMNNSFKNIRKIW